MYNISTELHLSLLFNFINFIFCVRCWYEYICFLQNTTWLSSKLLIHVVDGKYIVDNLCVSSIESSVDTVKYDVDLYT
jgi:hypothetical protein